MPIVHHTLILRYSCTLCPNEAELRGTPSDLGSNPRLPEGWTWAVRPRPYLPDTHKAPTQLGQASGELCEPLIFCCPTCTRRIEDAMTPLPSMRKRR